jgi:hydrogenase maturation protease
VNTLILYLGNPIVRNDQIGFIIGTRLKSQQSRIPEADILEFSGSPLDFISAVSGRDKLIIVDSISTGRYAKGTVVLFSRDELLETGSSFYLHGMNVAEAFTLMECFGLSMPDEVCLIGIEAGSLDRFGDSCDDELTAALASVEEKVMEIIRADRPDPPMAAH